MTAIRNSTDLFQNTADVQVASAASVANQRSNCRHASRPIAEPGCNPFDPLNPFDPYFQNC